MARDPAPVPEPVAGDVDSAAVERALPNLPGVTVIPARCGDVGPAARVLIDAFGRDLPKDLEGVPLCAAVLRLAENSIDKMRESNVQIRGLDPELSDDFLRETVVSNEGLIEKYLHGVTELRSAAAGTAGAQEPTASLGDPAAAEERPEGMFL
eukprot:TRINITY_DN57364_c0_g1_i1.p2 TRINITY_DN57364_c0_g1~~TRINITY_DN57364_c0_g1_i1.p2  ORF type:complete len:153 (-),score=40.32 TRINITY_DN57364_c0_g1_i1:93-551(-)